MAEKLDTTANEDEMIKHSEYSLDADNGEFEIFFDNLKVLLSFVRMFSK